MSAIRKAAVVMSCALLASVLGACGSSTSGGETTCAEWFALDDKVSLKDQLAGVKNKELEAVAKDALREAGKDTGTMNVMLLEGAVIQYCAPDGTGTRPNANNPISNAID